MPIDRLQVLVLRGKSLHGRFTCRPVDTHIRHFTLPARKMRLELPFEAAAGNGVLLEVANAVLGLTLGPRAKRCAGFGTNFPVPAEGREAAVEANLARFHVVLDDVRFGVVDEQGPRASAEVGERGFDSGEPCALPPVAERADQVATKRKARTILSPIATRTRPKSICICCYRYGGQLPAAR